MFFFMFVPVLSLSISAFDLIVHFLKMLKINKNVLKGRTVHLTQIFKKRKIDY